MPVLLANATFAILMFLAGCALVVTVLLRRSYRYFGKRNRSRVIQGLEHLPRPQDAWEGAQHDPSARVGRYEAEMADVARELSGQLTTKMILLEQLICESQKQIERMEELLDRAERRQPTATPTLGDEPV